MHEHQQSRPIAIVSYHENQAAFLTDKDSGDYGCGF
jgi:hypothetical protein